MSQLAELRIAMGFTQEYMAEKLEVSTVAYHMYETGKRKVPEEKADKIAEILEKQVEDIFLPSSFSLR